MTGETRASHDPRRRRGVPDRLLLPPGPREAEPARRWAALPFDRRRALASASLRGAGPAPRDEADLVRAVARARVATGWRLHLAAALLGWLVLMTIWGFGRSTYPEQEGAWLAGGLTAGVVVWLAGAVVVSRRLARARRVAAGHR